MSTQDQIMENQFFNFDSKNIRVAIGKLKENNYEQIDKTISRLVEVLNWRKKIKSNMRLMIKIDSCSRKIFLETTTDFQP